MKYRVTVSQERQAEFVVEAPSYEDAAAVAETVFDNEDCDFEYKGKVVHTTAEANEPVHTLNTFKYADYFELES